MKKNTPSIDGFIPRRPGSQIGELHDQKDVEKAIRPIDRSLHTGDNVSSDILGMPRPGKELRGDDLSDSLREIDDIDEEKKPSRRKKRRESRAERPRRKVFRIIKWVLISLGIIGILVAGYVILKAVLASNNVFQGSILDIVQNQPLKEDENGRSNFLIFGTAEDDEGGTHDGPNLTDSIMVLSVDQEKKDAYMLSLPRDLWIQHAETCFVGNQEKLNTVYLCGSNDGENEQAGADALRAKVGEITGLDIQYYIHLNFTAVIDAVDAVGGVDVTIESNPAGAGILDRNFDWKCNYTCYYVNYEDGETVHLDGEHALALARARNAQGGYGLAAGNFDREKNQQKIIKALREKAVSAGTVTNIGAVTGLIDALGNNLRTNIETKEIRTIMDLAGSIPSDKIISLSLNSPENMLVMNDSYLGRSIVRPIAGLFNYGDIQAYVEENVTSDPVTREAPHVSVLNGSGTAGAAQAQADRLEDEGFTIDAVDNAPEGQYENIEIYQINPDKTASAAKLAELYGVTLKTSAPPVSVVGETDFLIIVGSAQ